MYNSASAYTIVRLEEKNAGELAQLEKACFSSSWTEEQFANLLHASSTALSDGKSLPVWCAFGIFLPGESLAAYISLGLDVPGLLMEVYNIAVRRELRQKGLAGTLLRHSLHWAMHHGFERCLLEVREGNMPALRLYAKEGFKELGRRRKYYADTGEDAIVMLRNL